MDAIIVILSVRSLWRLLLSVALSIVLAVVLSTVFLEFTAGYCITLVLLGTGFGVYWGGRAHSGIGLFASVPHVSIAKPVVFLGLLFIGFIWGGLISWLLGSQLLGACALVLAAALTGAWFRFILHRTFSLSYFIFSSVSLLCGFALIPLLAALHA